MSGHDEHDAGGTDTTVTVTRDRDESAVASVVETVAEATGDDPVEMRPLYHVVDADALDAVFQPSSPGATSSGRVDFEFNGCDVTVHADGRTVVSARENSA